MSDANHLVKKSAQDMKKEALAKFKRSKKTRVDRIKLYMTIKDIETYHEQEEINQNVQISE